MDELKINSKFMRVIVSKILSKILKKKFGYKIDVQVNELNVTITEERAHVSLNIDGEMEVNELKKFTKFIEIDEESRI